MGLGRVAVTMAAAAFWLVGCAQPEIPYDRSAATDVKSIGIVTPLFPDRPTVLLASTVGQSFGLIGAMVDSGMQSSRETKFKAVLDQQSFSAPDIFIKCVTEQLQTEGYTVTVVPVTRDHFDFLAHYPTDAESKVDAYLDLVTTAYGYAAAGVRSSTPYRPAYVVRAKLVSARDASVLMQDLVVYNPINTTKKAITIAPDTSYQFKDFDALVADPENAAKGLRVAIEQSALTMTKLLK